MCAYVYEGCVLYFCIVIFWLCIDISHWSNVVQYGHFPQRKLLLLLPVLLISFFLCSLLLLFKILILFIGLVFNTSVPSVFFFFFFHHCFSAKIRSEFVIVYMYSACINGWITRQGNFKFYGSFKSLAPLLSFSICNKYNLIYAYTVFHFCM